MADGLYQSVILFYMAYLAFLPGNFVTHNGLNIDDRERFGVYIAPAAIMVINTYILLNTYRWDWLMLVLVFVSSMLVWFWTGVYSAFSSSEYFYKAATEVFAQPTFWAVTCLSVILSLAPRFFVKSVQKIYFPYDVDIIREQVRQGKFDYLNKGDAPTGEDALSNGSTSTSYDAAKPSKHTHYPSVDEDQRPIYPPSVAATNTTHNPRSQNGSDGTEFTRHRTSLDHPVRPSMDRVRPSYDRVRASMDRIRPSYEQSNDFTSAALLTRMESSQSFGPVHSRRNMSRDVQ